MRKIKYLSHSQVSTYLKCGRLYYLRYCLGKKIPPPWVLPLGSSCHDGIEYNLKQKIASREDLAISKVLEAYAFSFESHVQKEEINWQGQKPKIVKDIGIKLVKVYHEERCPVIQPIAVEAKIEVPFDNVDYYFLCYLDTIDDKKTVIDLKTSQKTPIGNEAILSSQLTAYALAYRVKYGEPERAVRLEYMVNTAKAKTVPLEATRSTEEIDQYLETMGRVRDGIEKEVFCRPPEGAWWCSRKSCGFFDKFCFPRRVVVSLTKFEEQKEREAQAKKKEAEAKKREKEAKKKAKEVR